MEKVTVDDIYQNPVNKNQRDMHGRVYGCYNGKWGWLFPETGEFMEDESGNYQDSGNARRDSADEGSSASSGPGVGLGQQFMDTLSREIAAEEVKRQERREKIANALPIVVLGGALGWVMAGRPKVTLKSIVKFLLHTLIMAVGIILHVLSPLLSELTGEMKNMDSNFPERLLANAICLLVLWMASSYLNSDHAKGKRKHPTLYLVVLFAAIYFTWGITHALLSSLLDSTAFLGGFFSRTLTPQILQLVRNSWVAVVVLAVSYFVARCVTKLLRLDRMADEK